MLTRKEVEQALPANLKSSATQALTDQINALVQDPIVAETIREHFITYAVVLQEGKWGMDAYMNAIQYTTYKMMGYSNQEAYQRTFPARYQKFIQDGTSSKDISAYVSQYHKGKLVQAILEQSLVPVWLLNQETYQRAINVQADLMMNAQSEMVRTAAANSILTHLAKPKEVVAKISLDTTESSGINELREAMTKLAEQQQDLIRNGISPKEIAGQRIIEGEKVS